MPRPVRRDIADLPGPGGRRGQQPPLTPQRGSVSVRPLRLFVIQRTRIYRDATVRLFGEAASVVVVGAAASVDDALVRIDRLRPDLVVLDAVAHRPQHVRALRARSTGTMVVAMALPDVADDIEEWLEAGVLTYVPPEGSAADLLAVVDGLARRGASAPPAEARADEDVTQRARSALTLREHEIAGLLARGLSNKQIARRLSIQVQTVKNHASRVFEKLGVRTRSELAARLKEPPTSSGTS